MEVTSDQQHTDLPDAQPVCQVSGIGQRCGQTNHSHGTLGVGGDEVGPGHNHLKDRASVLTCGL